MQDSNQVAISVSRIIPAQRLRVIRAVTKVWEFPRYMPNVKEAAVLDKGRNRIKTR